METFEVLEKALGLIEDEKHWCRGMAATPDGKRCAVGALRGVFDSEEEDFRRAAVALTLQVPTSVEWLSSKPGPKVAAFNDSRSHAEVCDLFKAAVRAEKAKAGIPIELPESERVHA